MKTDAILLERGMKNGSHILAKEFILFVVNIRNRYRTAATTRTARSKVMITFQMEEIMIAIIAHNVMLPNSRMRPSIWLIMERVSTARRGEISMYPMREIRNLRKKFRKGSVNWDIILVALPFGPV